MEMGQIKGLLGDLCCFTFPMKSRQSKRRTETLLSKIILINISSRSWYNNRKSKETFPNVVRLTPRRNRPILEGMRAGRAWILLNATCPLDGQFYLWFNECIYFAQLREALVCDTARVRTETKRSLRSYFHGLLIWKTHDFMSLLIYEAQKNIIIWVKYVIKKKKRTGLYHV